MREDHVALTASDLQRRDGADDVLLCLLVSLCETRLEPRVSWLHVHADTHLSAGC